MYGLASPFLFGLDAERAHALTPGRARRRVPHRDQPVARRGPEAARGQGVRAALPQPGGPGRGLDKNGAHIDALMALGFGFVEVGTTTPRPQAGNPKPRMFRLPSTARDHQRLGFNNEAWMRWCATSRARGAARGLLGINIGKNKDTPNESAESDYLFCLERVYPLADYITVNISSPNTAGLRELQEEQRCGRLVARCAKRRNAGRADTGDACRCW
jgi:dihydroorotate dehydrogenase